MRRDLTSTLAALALASAAAMAFAQQPAGPVMTPEVFFSAPVSGEGTITTLYFWQTKFTNRFEGRVVKGELLIEESFAFPDATRKQFWRLTPVADGRYDGDVTTQGEDGRMRGPVPVDGWADADGFHLDYAGYAPDGGDTTFRFRHHLAPQPDGTVVNSVSVSWWGLPLAYSRTVFTRAS